ncbi:MAG: N-acetyl sugar amidotransferase [Chitinophagaceae bacterium]|nr:MAG: N-acetyl sugar amidotransferase [Chitinophagaceae bacterium]
MFSWTYNEKALQADPGANNGRPYQRCTRTVMDTIADPDVQFDEEGVSQYFYKYREVAKQQLFFGAEGQKKIEAMIAELKANQKGKYDCVIGLSGGVDSTYLVYKAKEWGLNPLVVHFDYGWNLELAVQNIERTLKYAGFELYTHVMNWEDFKQLQRAYFKAGVLDLDVPADHLIFAALNMVCRKFNIKYVLKGFNVQSEAILPRTWNYHGKFDLMNLQDIYAQYGPGRRIKNLPKLGIWQRIYYDRVFRLRSFTPLNYFDYDKTLSKQELIEKVGWVDYGGKHFENVFTRFYQGYILPTRFHIDKRKAHLSTLICSGQMTREEALAELEKPPYDLKLMEEDYNYVSKKLDFTPAEFDAVLRGPIRKHSEFREEAKLHALLSKLTRPFLGKKNNP